MNRTLAALVACWFAAGLTAVPAADAGGWIDLFGGKDLSAWQEPTTGWRVVKAVALDPANPRKLKVVPGEGILYAAGRGKDLLTKRSFTDVEVHAEFVIPKRSNSGIKL